MNVQKKNTKTGPPLVHVLGVSHKTAPVEFREKFSLSADLIQGFLHEARCSGVDEIVYLSTCNRVEIYFVAPDGGDGADIIVKMLCCSSGKAPAEIRGRFYEQRGIEAVKHCLSVASSLDSMVIGENEIFGQMKEAYRVAVEGSSTGPVLNRLFHHAFNAAKKVKTETGIARNPLSIAYIACEQARKVFDDLSTKKALLIGAGEMGELILKYFTKYDIRDITVANRSQCNAERIVGEINRDARIIGLGDLSEAMVLADIVISSVASPEYIVTAASMRDFAKKRKGRPLFIIDIAVPRNIDPDIISINDVFLFNIDDLKRIADENMKNRIREVAVASEMIVSSASEFMRWMADLQIAPVIETMRNAFNGIRERETAKYRRRKLKHLSDEDFRIVEELTRQIMSKTLHNPIMALKHISGSGNSECVDAGDVREKTRILRELFTDEDKA